MGGGTGHGHGRVLGLLTLRQLVTRPSLSLSQPVTFSPAFVFVFLSRDRPSRYSYSPTTECS
eukprot:5277172-Pyramimonas_sp.AAC.1